LTSEALGTTQLVKRVLLSGDKNNATGWMSVAIGGEFNEAAGDSSAAVGGEFDNANGSECVVVRGYENRATVAVRVLASEPAKLGQPTGGVLPSGAMKNKASGKEGVALGWQHAPVKFFGGEEKFGNKEWQ
jgi:hypothetical protein